MRPGMEQQLDASTLYYTGSQLSFLGFVAVPVFLLGMTSRAWCIQSKAAPFRIREPSWLHANQAVSWNQFTWACCQRKMFMCVRILKDWIERSEARLSRMGLGRIPHVLRGQAEDKRRYSREAKKQKWILHSLAGKPRNSAILQTKPLGLRSCTGHASSIDLHKTFKTLISYQNANILSDGPKTLV